MDVSTQDREGERERGRKGDKSNFLPFTLSPSLPLGQRSAYTLVKNALIRRATPEDAEAISGVLHQAFAAYEPLYTPQAFRVTTSAPAEVLERAGRAGMGGAARRGPRRHGLGGRHGKGLLSTRDGGDTGRAGPPDRLGVA